VSKQNWNERFNIPEYRYGTDPNQFLATNAGRIPAGRVLCLGDGEGRNGVYLAGLGYDVTSVDQSDVGLAKTGRLAEERGVEIKTVEADLADYTIEPGCWSGIVSIFCHLPPDLRRRVHAAAAEGLTAGGVFILEAYTPRQLRFKTGGPPTAELMMTLDALREDLAGLRLEVARETDRDLREGTCHTGTGAVVQVVAVKE
jgi:SAM-dependent methyltransferase